MSDSDCLRFCVISGATTSMASSGQRSGLWLISLFLCSNLEIFPFPAEDPPPWQAPVSKVDDTCTQRKGPCFFLRPADEAFPLIAIDAIKLLSSLALRLDAHSWDPPLAGTGSHSHGCFGSVSRAFFLFRDGAACACRCLELAAACLIRAREHREAFHCKVVSVVGSYRVLRLQW